MPRPMSSVRPGALLCLAVLATAALAVAEEPPAPKPAAPPATSAAPAAAALMATLDPQSREPREPSEELARLRAELQAMLAELPDLKGGTTGELPQGGRYFKVPVWMSEALFVQAGADGTFVSGCTDLARLPERIVRRQPPAPAPLR